MTEDIFLCHAFPFTRIPPSCQSLTHKVIRSIRMSYSRKVLATAAEDAKVAPPAATPGAPPEKKAKNAMSAEEVLQKALKRAGQVRESS